MTEDDVRDLRIKFTILDEVELRVPNSSEIADNPCEQWFAVYEIFFDLDLRFPLPGLASAILAHYWIAVGQLMPNSWRVILRVAEVGSKVGIEPSEVDFRALYYMKQNIDSWGRFIFVTQSRNSMVFGDARGSDYEWRNHFVMIRGSVDVPSSLWETPTKWGHPSES